MAGKVKGSQRTRVSSKNQVTLPVSVLAEARVKAGDNVRVESDGDGRIMIVRDRDPLDDLIGSAPGLSAATNLQALRDEWEQ
jgi:bifunctional DNA-binding transcriptional regulator/antitoxin component of YhaV-PrlF toxin-antitoxin module